MYFVFLFIAAILIYYLIASSRYKKTDYYRATKKSFLYVRFNTGCFGEYLTYKYLRRYEEDGAKFLYNCYLPKDKGQTTEVDVMMIHRSGVYVFESKNYSGWIFGSENAKTWTQTLPSGRKAHKEHFLNPIMQNKLHIRWLENQIGESYSIHSVIVFSERCTLKKIDVISPNIFVIKRDKVLRTVREIAGKTGISISQEQVEALYTKLYPFTQVSEDVKQKHIENIKEEHAEEFSDSITDDESAVSDEMLLCPKCGGKLVLRVSEKGTYAGSQFYGCSNFPRCRYMKKVQ